MFKSLILASLQNRLIVAGVAFALMVFGVVTVRDMSVDALPDVNRPTVTLMTEAPGLAPEEIEALVSFPIESTMLGLPGVIRVRSASTAGLAIVYVEFDWNTDVFRARQTVTERMDRLGRQLPPGTEVHMGPIQSVMGEILVFTVRSVDTDMMTARELADWVVRPRLMAVSGVTQVLTIGGKVRQYRVTPNVTLMKQADISLNDLQSSLTHFAENSGGGFLNQGNQEYVIRNIGRTNRLEDLRNLVVGQRGRHPILLRQIAEVHFGQQFPRGEAGFMGEPAILVAVKKQPWVDTVSLVRDIEVVISELQRSMPEGIEIGEVLYKQSDFIEASIDNLADAIVEAAVFVTVILFIFLSNVRATVISVIAIPISVLVTLLVLKVMGQSANTMTLGGMAIAIGALVDDAVVDVENVFRRLRENRRLAAPLPVIEVVARASVEVRSGIVYATLIVVLAVVPLFFLSGLEGRLFSALGGAYVLSILASMLTAVTITPVLCYYLLPGLAERPAAEADGRVLAMAKRLNRRVVGWALDNGRSVLFGIGGVALLALALMVALPRVFLPPFNEGPMVVLIESRPGISLVEAGRIARVAENLLLEMPEVRLVGRRTGRAEFDEHVEGVNFSDIYVDFAETDRTRGELRELIRRRLAVLPVRLMLDQPMSHRMGIMLTGGRTSIVVKLFGDDLDKLRSQAEDLRANFAGIPGIRDLSVEAQVRIPQIKVVVDYEWAANLGVTPASVTNALEVLSGGREVSQILEGQRRFDLMLRISDPARRAVTLRDLLIETPNGKVPLGNFAVVEDTDGPNSIYRENGRRRILIQANAEPSEMGAVVGEIEKRLAVAGLPTGYFAVVEGSYKQQEEAARIIALLFGAAVLIVFTLLYNRYQSTALSLVIMANIPLALIGGVFAVWLSGQPLSLASMVGFVALAGISARNGILKVSHFLNLALHEGESFGRHLILRGCDERVAPVAMTTLSTGLALIPLLIGAETPGKEVLHPVAVTIFGGLASAMVMDTVLTPVLFSLVGRARIEELSRTRGAAVEPAADVGGVY
ncbi:heavy metal efflux pump CzcA [alpha proteobacterium BAL199]|jgi:heavy-metal exporter, HME family|nr:heavy metal efflux pump CzcA [alpha proteobacterium BAL199]